ncbi:putative spermidine/putrescine transport system permease protein [Aureimonas altamirensis DSM 21988]|uniref:Spermidine/putrescine ABC transporter permease n=2 Tax=Aureimonas altamirensis TaxID=370622 RepID=A0A0P0YW51_9HYPH|nr:ABC transporter permease [Aureimonas altamirensis]BAT25608.1 spermidine/putrescine ABC transporter permease [Aureimonas altamirensis]SHI41503.1 putative spermidine/putrescine transport system permease protein [Aureimonas altamirensis DSM 21988]
MTDVTLSTRLRAGLLVLPLALFLAVFFIWPLWTMIAVAVRDDAMAGALPETAAVIGGWDGEAPPSMDIQQAFMKDLREVDNAKLGPAVRRLNSAASGFRTLMGKTQRAARDMADGDPVDMVAIDDRWGDPTFWTAIQNAASPYTDRNLLAAVDLERNDAGDIEARPAGSSANRLIIWRTFSIAAVITLFCIAIGLPYAMLAASVTGWKRNILLLAVLLPLWTSLLVRTAAWFILLQDQGLINRTLMDLGLISGPLPLIFNRAGVIVAMTHVLLPFMVLPIYSVITAIPKNLMPAAASMGASPLRAFWRVLLPLSLPGVLSGSLLVFMVAIGYYITPALVGGPNDQMISSIIAFYALQTANWGMAGALGIILLVVTTLLYVVYNRLSRNGAPLGA